MMSADVAAVSDDIDVEACRRVCWWGEVNSRGPIYKNRNARECNGFKDERAYAPALPGNC